jgi:hypothetical protein
LYKFNVDTNSITGNSSSTYASSIYIYLYHSKKEVVVARRAILFDAIFGGKYEFPKKIFLTPRDGYFTLLVRPVNRSAHVIGATSIA